MKRYLFLMAGTLFLGSCSVMKQANYNEVAYRNLEPKQDAVVVPLKGEIDVLRDRQGNYLRIKGESQNPNGDLKNGVVVYRLEETLSSYAIQEWKKRAVNEVAKSYEADLIVGALIDVEYSENEKIDKHNKEIKAVLTVRVSGYPARFKGFRNLEVADPAVLDYYIRTTDTGDSANRHRHEETSSRH